MAGNCKIQCLCRLLSITVSVTLMACDFLGTTCVGDTHYVYREVTVRGVSDTMYVGDTISFNIHMPWVNASSANGETFDIRDTDLPNSNDVTVFATRAPKGQRDSISNTSNFNTGRTLAFHNENFIPGDGEWNIGWNGADIQGDSTDQGWEAGGRLVFTIPGRHTVEFLSTRSDKGRTESDAIRADGITRPGCEERIIIDQKLLGYESNQEMVDQLERESDVLLLRTVQGFATKTAGFYILVLE